jgi:hypothetical protein
MRRIAALILALGASATLQRIKAEAERRASPRSRSQARSETSNDGS